MKRLLLIAAFVLCCSTVWGRELQVRPGDYNSIQSAIDDANDGDVVVVSAGTYPENIDFLGKAITVRSADPNDPNVVAVTIIDGNQPDDPDQGSAVTFRSGEDNNSTLAGFTITGGTGSWLLVSWEFNGLCWNRCGGGVVCYNMSAPTISKNVFVDNTAGQGGGIYIYGDPVDPNDPSNPTVHVSPVISDNTFINNTAIRDHNFAAPDSNYPANDHGDGGAIVAFQGVDAIIKDNLVENNHADFYGGGLHIRQWSNGLIEDNQIVGNDSRLGAGIHITYISSPTVRDNLLQANTAGSLGGGGIYIYYYSNPLIERNTITANSSTNGAGIGVYWDSAPDIRSNLIYNNLAGAGLQLFGTAATVTHNTITGNFYNGIECYSIPSDIIENNIISSNGQGWGIYVNEEVLPVIRYNNVWGNGSGAYGPSMPDQTGINGNISVEPGFVNAEGNDYHLSYNSKCINSGDPNYSGADVTDYDSEPRRMGQFVDIGADEARPVWNITSNEQYENIQQGIDDANDGDIIIVTIGIHTGEGNRDIDYGGKAVTLRSIDPNAGDVVAATIIDSNGSVAEYHRGFYFRHQEGPNSILAGFTITGGGGIYDGGAIKCSNHSSPTVKNCIITNNASRGRGGGLHCWHSSPTVMNCSFTNNIATWGYGGAIACLDESSPTILNCAIINNQAQGRGHHGGGIYAHNYSNPLVANCIITANSAEHRGGGVSAYESRPTLVNCSLIGNVAAEGGGISSFCESNPQVINCIVRNNRAPDGNQLALINTSRVWEGTNIPTEMTVSFSDVEGGYAGACVDHDCTLHWGEGNIDADANFVDVGYWDDANTPAEPNDDFFVAGDYHLYGGSPCIDAGDNNSVPEGVMDLDGEARFVDGDCNCMNIVDMGTYEFGYVGDFDCDVMVNTADFAIFALSWLTEPGDGRWNPCCDISIPADSYIDWGDLGVLMDNWLAGL